MSKHCPLDDMMFQRKLIVSVTHVFRLVLQQQPDLVYRCWSLKKRQQKTKGYYSQQQYTLDSDGNSLFATTDRFKHTVLVESPMAVLILLPFSKTF